MNFATLLLVIKRHGYVDFLMLIFISEPLSLSFGNIVVKSSVQKEMSIKNFTFNYTSVKLEVSYLINKLTGSPIGRSYLLGGFYAGGGAVF